MTERDAAEAAWLAYRDDYQRKNPWLNDDPRRASRQMRKREFVAGYIAGRAAAAHRPESGQR